jgi:hypothetical protein
MTKAIKNRMVWLDTKEAGELAGCTRYHISRLAGQGKLRYFKLRGGTIMFVSQDDVIEYANRRKQETQI